MVICPECESTNNEPDTIDEFPAPSNVQIWLCMDCLATFYTTQSVNLSVKIDAHIELVLNCSKKGW